MTMQPSIARFRVAPCLVPCRLSRPRRGPPVLRVSSHGHGSEEVAARGTHLFVLETVADVAPSRRDQRVQLRHEGDEPHQIAGGEGNDEGGAPGAMRSAADGQHFSFSLFLTLSFSLSLSVSVVGAIALQVPQPTGLATPAIGCARVKDRGLGAERRQEGSLTSGSRPWAPGTMRRPTWRPRPRGR